MKMNRVDQNVTQGWVAHVTESHLSDDSLVFIATHPLFRGVIGQGRSRHAAIVEFNEGLEAVIADMKASGLPIPKPNGIFFETTISLQAGSMEVPSLKSATQSRPYTFSES